MLFLCLKHRRVPLIELAEGVKESLMTVSYASIKKYLDTAIELTKKYDVSEYTVECVNIAQNIFMIYSVLINR